MKKAINSFFQLDALKKTMKRQYAWIFSLLILNYVKKGDSYTVYHTEPCTECSTKEAIDSFFLVEYFNKNTICIDFHFHSPKSQ